MDFIADIVDAHLAAQRTAWVPVRDGIAVVAYSAADRSLARALGIVAGILAVVAPILLAAGWGGLLSSELSVVIGWVSGAFAMACGVVAAYFALEMRRIAVLDARGIRVRTPVGGELHVAWADLRRARRSLLGGAVIVRALDRTIVFPRTMCGLGTLHQMIVEYAPQVKIPRRVRERMTAHPM